MPVRGSRKRNITPVPQRSRKDRAGLLLLMGGLLLLALPLYLAFDTLSDQDIKTQADVEALAVVLEETVEPDPQITSLQGRLDTAKGHRDALLSITNNLGDGSHDWPAILIAVGDYDTAALRIQEVSHTGSELLLTGSAVSDQAVMDYTQRLQSSSCFHRVVVQSMQVVDKPYVQASPPPAATSSPTGTASPSGTPVASATVAPTSRPEGDTFEPDDTVPVDIYPGKAQAHTFYPPYDVDMVQFLAKAGRFYRVYTCDLEPGVDTSLSVSLGGQVYVNDDRASGDLSSELVLVVPAGADLQAVVQITNRGQYGAAQGYTIAIEEVVGQQTATPSATAWPTATTPAEPSSSPTPTSVPEPSTQPTFGLSDMYEPDDYEAASINPGQSQIRTFYPDLDTDQVTFTGLPGHRYTISTGFLYPGVDTHMTVWVGEAVYDNDNCTEGELSSCITITIEGEQSAQVTVKVTNQGTFGPGQLYSLAVDDIGMIEQGPEPTLEPSPMPTAVSDAAAALGRPASFKTSQRLSANRFAIIRRSMPQASAATSVEFCILLELEANE